MSWFGALKTLVDLFGSDSPGAQPYNAAVAAVTGTQLAIAASNALPNRPVTAAAPSFFIFTPSGVLTAATTYIAQVPGSTPPVAANAYYPGDLVRLSFTLAQLNGAGHNVIVQTAPTPTTLYTLLQASAAATGGGGYIDIQLNPAGTAWQFIGAAYF